MMERQRPLNAAALGMVIMAFALVPFGATESGATGPDGPLCVPDEDVRDDCKAGYATIQQAVDAAVAGELILVGPGDHPEPVSIDKPLSIQGAVDHPVPECLVGPGWDLPRVGVAAGSLPAVTILTSGVHMQCLEIVNPNGHGILAQGFDGTPGAFELRRLFMEDVGGHGIVIEGDAPVDNPVSLELNQILNSAMDSIVVVNTTDTRLYRNVFQTGHDGVTAIVVSLRDGQAPHSGQIQIVETNVGVASAGNGIRVNVEGAVSVSELQIQSNWIPGIAIALGPGSTVDKMDLQENAIRNNSNGLAAVSIEASPSTSIVDAVVRGNDFQDNAVGLRLDGVVAAVDARANYWGSPTGPTHPDNPAGNGGSIEGEGVDYFPWCVTSGCLIGPVPGLIDGLP